MYTARGVSLSGVFGIHAVSWQVATNIKIYKNLQQSPVVFNTITVFFDRVYTARVLGPAEYPLMEGIRLK